MEDVSSLGQFNHTNSSASKSRGSKRNLEPLEPQRKKRCVRFPSDQSAEDPSLVSDSGFGDSSPGEDIENGDQLASFFDLNGEDADANIELPNNAIDFIPPEGKESLKQQPVPEEETQSNLSSISDPLGAGSSRSCSSSSSFANDTFDNSRLEGEDEEEESEESMLDAQILDILTNTKEIAGNPARAEMMQRFISHLKSNPNDAQLQHFLALLLSGPEFQPPRQRLRHVTTIQDAARLLRCSKKILVLTGAGISVSCGIPDFRSKDGLYSRVAKVFPDLRDPQSVFDIKLFRRDPRPFFLTAKELYPGQFEPSLSHRFIKRLEARGQLLRNYSQNIDTLETIAGIERVTMCHGSFATATCIRCRTQVSCDEIKDKVLSGQIPYCKSCSTAEETDAIVYPLGQPQERGENDDDDEVYPVVENFPLAPVVKPDIVFFGEDLPDEFHDNLQQDKPICDLVVVIGSSLRVRPVSLIPGMVPAEVPQILINREALPHCRFDVELLGNCDHIIAQLCKMMGSDFNDMAEGPELREIDKLPKGTSSEDGEISDPKSEHDIQALKACWEPKTNEKVIDRMPPDTYLLWRQRQYIFEGAEEIYDPDEDEDDSDSSDASSSCSSLQSEGKREAELDDELELIQQKRIMKSGIPSTVVIESAEEPTSSQQS